ncbi:MAG: anti-sigma factor family protein [Oscillospiraceae bacterium]
MSNCMHYQQQISQLLDGELPAEQAQTLRAHLRTCPDCRRVYDDFLSLQAAVRDAAAEPPADLTARIMQQVRREPVPMAPRAAIPARPARHVQPTPIHKSTAGQTGRAKAPGLRPHVSPAADLGDGGVSRAHPRRNALVRAAQKPAEQLRYRARQQPGTDRDRISLRQG